MPFSQLTPTDAPCTGGKSETLLPGLAPAAVIATQTSPGMTQAQVAEAKADNLARAAQEVPSEALQAAQMAQNQVESQAHDPTSPKRSDCVLGDVVAWARGVSLTSFKSMGFNDAAFVLETGHVGQVVFDLHEAKHARQISWGRKVEEFPTAFEEEVLYRRHLAEFDAMLQDTGLLELFEEFRNFDRAVTH